MQNTGQTAKNSLFGLCGAEISSLVFTLRYKSANLSVVTTFKYMVGFPPWQWAQPLTVI